MMVAEWLSEELAVHILWDHLSEAGFFKYHYWTE